MTIEWKTTEKTFTVNEGDVIDVSINYSPSNAKMTILSSSLPTEISVINYGGYIKIYGKAPQVIEDTSYFITIRLTEYDESNQVVDISDNYYEIKVISLPLEWDLTDSTNIDIVVYTEFNKQLKLLNKNGNESFKKVGGELPYGISLSSDGILYGSINGISEGEQTEYEFMVNIFVDGKEVSSSLERTYKIFVKDADSGTAPHWITEQGSIGNISFNEKSKFKVLAYDMNGDSTLSYELDRTLDSSYRLPPGLTLNSLTGNIDGVLNTTQYSTYTFGIIASKLVNGEQINSETRIFSITTNDVSKEHQIVWDTNDTLDLGRYYVGNEIVGYVPTPKVEDGSEIKFTLGSGNIPKGLILNENGTFGGVLEHQIIGDYFFTIIAETKYVSVTKNVVMHLAKGLGKNAIKMYLRINNEYRDEYLNIKSQFNPNTAYKSNNSNFVVDAFPKIDVAVLTCYDREILSHLINFGNPVIVRIKDTKSLIHSQINNYGDPIENYEVIYKSVDESTYQWEDLDVGGYNFDEKLEQLKADGKIENNTLLDFNNESYNSGETTPQVSYSVFNFKNFRDLLTQKFYVYKKSGDYYYSLGSQELFNVDNIVDEYYLYQDESTLKYKITKNLYTSESDVDVEYNCGCVYDKSHNPMLSILFKPCVITQYGLLESYKPFVKFSEEDEPYYLQKISNPICFDREKNSSSVTIDNIPNSSEMVLPMITEDDLNYDTSDSEKKNPYIKFLDYDVEQIPEWKRIKPKNWTPNTQYMTGDVIINDSIYYECLQQFKSDETFVDDKNLLKVLTNEEIGVLLSKSFFPTLDLGYYEVNTNRYYMNQVRAKEQNGEYWYNKDFLFYEVICEPLFNKDIEKFCVWFKEEQEL